MNSSLPLQIESAIKSLNTNGRLVYAKKKAQWLPQLNLLSCHVGLSIKRTRSLQIGTRSMDLMMCLPAPIDGFTPYPLKRYRKD